MYFITYQYREHERETWQDAIKFYEAAVLTEHTRSKNHPGTRLDYPMVTGDGRDDECDGLTEDERVELEDIFCDTIRSNQ